jgi:hypothetical protein
MVLMRTRMTMKVCMMNSCQALGAIEVEVSVSRLMRWMSSNVLEGGSGGSGVYIKVISRL